MKDDDDDDDDEDDIYSFIILCMLTNDADYSPSPARA